MSHRILIVDDSAVERALLEEIFRAHGFVVAGFARDGEEALAQMKRLRPDVVTMDIVMPRMDGVEATRRILAEHAVPIVVLSAQSNPVQVRKAFEACEAGALEAVQKPYGPGHPQHEASITFLIERMRVLAEVRPVRRPLRAAAMPAQTPPVAASGVVELVAVGASTGGPQALQVLLRAVAPLAVPMVVVQHLSPGFLVAMVNWLTQTTGVPVAEAQAGDRPLAGHVYLAPDDHHLALDLRGRFRWDVAPPRHRFRPSIDYFFETVADTLGPRAVGVLLTGMGSDGAAGIARMQARGAVTIGQDAQSSLIYGMPAEASRLGALTHELSLDAIGPLLRRLAAVPAQQNATL